MENQNETKKETKKEVAVKQQEAAQSAELIVQGENETSVFINKESFEHSQRVAKMLGQSQLIPKDYQNNIPNCMIALEMATRMGASPLMVMQNLYIVHGRPAWSSQFLIATLNACGKFTSLRYEENETKDGGSTRCYAIDKATGEVVHGAWVSMNMAKAEGWIDKNGSKWKTMPELMRRYRAAAFFTRQFAPEVSMGIITQEEVIDIPYTEVQKEITNEELKSLFLEKSDKLNAEDLKRGKEIIETKETTSYKKLFTLLKSKA